VVERNGLVLNVAIAAEIT